MKTYDERDWILEALCYIDKKPTDFFFPERGGDVGDVTRYCAACTVKEHCENYAVTNNIWIGIWGGKSGRQRRSNKAQNLRIQRAMKRGLRPCD
jgi:hypothetical protein